MSDEGTYEKPAHGWTCFHCGETFKKVGAARDHFGAEPSVTPACRIKAGGERGLLMELRKAEAEIARLWMELHEERYSGAVLALHQQASRHFDQLRDAEESGYDRGLRDGMRMRREELAEIDA